MLSALVQCSPGVLHIHWRAFLAEPGISTRVLRRPPRFYHPSGCAAALLSWCLLQRRCLAPCCAGTLGAFEAAEVALRILHALVQGQAAADASGRPLLPLPRVRRQLASPACLPHLAQARSLQVTLRSRAGMTW